MWRRLLPERLPPDRPLGVLPEALAAVAAEAGVVPVLEVAGRAVHGRPMKRFGFSHTTCFATPPPMASNVSLASVKAPGYDASKCG